MMYKVNLPTITVSHKVQDASDTQKNFQNLLHFLVKDDINKRESYFKSLNQEVVKEQHAFDAMRKELVIRRHKYSNKNRNFEQMDTNQNLVAAKREIKNNCNTEHPVANSDTESISGSTSSTPQISESVNVDKTPVDLKEACKIISALKEDLNQTKQKCSYYEMIFGLRVLIQGLEEELYPSRALSRVDNRYYRWLIILLTCQKHPKVQLIWHMIATQAGPRIDVREFAEETQKFFPDDSKALLSLGFPTGCIDPTLLDSVLKTEGKKLSIQERLTMSMLLSTKYPKVKMNQSEVDDPTGPEDYVDLQYRCIRIKGQFEFRDHNTADKEIRSVRSKLSHKFSLFFRETDQTPAIEQVQDMTSEWGEGNYKVEFYYVNYAIKALHEHQLSMRYTRHEFTLFLIHCDTRTIWVHTFVQPPPFADKA